MFEFERLTTEDGIQGVTEEDLFALSRAIPWVLAAKDFLIEQPRYYYSRMSCFLIGFCYGGLARHFIGDLAQLWSQGVFRDECTFFFGGTGGFSGCIIWGVEQSTGHLVRLKATPEITWNMSSRIRSSGGEMKSVLRPSPGTEQADFSETLKLLKDHFEPVEIFGLPEPVPSGFEHINASISLESIARTFPKEHNREPESSRLLRPSSTIGGNQRRKLSAVMQRPINIFEWSAARQKTDISIPCSELPVSGVTWHECMRFAKCLTIADPEFDYRLPAVSELQDFDKKAEDSSTGIEYKELHEWCCPLPEKPSLSEEASGPRKEMKPIYCRGALQGKVLQRLPWSVPSGYLASIGFRLVRTEKEKAW